MAMYYLEQAGQQALRGNANQEAVGFFNALLDWDRKWDNPSVSPLQRTRWQGQLGSAYYGLGQLSESRKILERVLALSDRSMLAMRGGLAVGLLGQVLRQVLHRLRPASLGRYSSEAGAALLETARACDLLGAIYYQANESIPAVYVSLRALNLAERVEPLPVLARAYAMMCLAAGLVPLHSLAETYSRRAYDVAQSVGDLPSSARVLEVMGLYALGVGQWAKALDLLERAADTNERLGNRREWDESMAILSWIHYFQGRLTYSTKLWVDVTTSAYRDEDPWTQIWGLCGQAESRLPRERLHLDQLLSLVEKAKALLSERVGCPEQIRVYGLLAKVYLRRGEPRLAEQAAETTAHWIAQTSPTTFYSFEGYAGAAKAYLALWEAGGDQSPAEREALAKSARQACKTLREFARVFPVARPRAWLWQGLYDCLDGKLRRARKAWHKSLAEAVRLGMPYEQGLTHYEIGRHLATGDPARQEHLGRAMEILWQIEAAYDLARVEELLEHDRNT